MYCCNPHHPVRLRPQNLGCDINRSPALVGHETIADAAREPEVGESDAGIVGLGGQQQVLRLKVAMHHPLVMEVFDCSKQHAAQIPCFLLVVESLRTSERALGGPGRAGSNAKLLNISLQGEKMGRFLGRVTVNATGAVCHVIYYTILYYAILILFIV